MEMRVLSATIILIFGFYRFSSAAPFDDSEENNIPNALFWPVPVANKRTELVLRTRHEIPDDGIHLPQPSAPGTTFCEFSYRHRSTGGHPSRVFEARLESDGNMRCRSMPGNWDCLPVRYSIPVFKRGQLTFEAIKASYVCALVTSEQSLTDAPISRVVQN